MSDIGNMVAAYVAKQIAITALIVAIIGMGAVAACDHFWLYKTRSAQEAK